MRVPFSASVAARVPRVAAASVADSLALIALPPLRVGGAGVSLAPLIFTVSVAVPVAGLALASVAVTVKLSLGVAPPATALMAVASGT